MQIKDITRVGFSSGRPSQKEGHLSIGNSLFGQVIIDDKSVFAIVSEVLSDGTAGVGCQELKWGSIRGSSGDDESVVHGSVLFKDGHHVGNGGPLLAHCHVNAVELANLVVGLEVLLLVDDRVNGNSGFASLSVAYDKLSLASADWHQTVHRF